MKTKIGLYKGKPIEEMTREELIEALVEMSNAYTELLKDNIHRFYNKKTNENN